MPESIGWRLPSSSTYWNSCWPGNCWQWRMMRASLRSSSTTLLRATALAAKEKNARAVAQELHVIVAQRRQPVGLVGARVLFVADAQQRLVEQACTIAARTLFFGSPGSARSCFSRRRSRGSCAPNSIMRANLPLSRVARHCG